MKKRTRSKFPSSERKMGAMRYDFKTPICFDELRMNCWPKIDAAATDEYTQFWVRAYFAGRILCS